MPVNVKNDTPAITKKRLSAIDPTVQTAWRFLDNWKYFDTMNEGWTTKPTPRSDKAKLARSMFEGE
jgi:hypothetical protein